MMHRKEGSALLLAVFITSLLAATTALAQLTCSDVTYGTENYSENMDKLAELAKLPDSYWSRYHEDVVSDLCKGDTKGVDSLVDTGQVKPQEAEGIAKVLGKTYKAKQRSAAGKSYGDSRKKFSAMGACSACADNIAQYYTNKPDSPCGKLATQALAGNPDAIKKLVAFPDYCKWKY